MHPQLKNDKSDFQKILNRTVGLATSYLDKIDDLPPGRLIDDIKITSLPEKGIGATAALDLFQKNFADKLSASAGPKYFGFVTGGSTPASVAGDWLVSAYDQNACGSNDSIAPQMEKQTIHFMKQLFGLDEDYFGSFTSGATLANFVGLALGRQWVGQQLGVDISNEGLD